MTLEQGSGLTLPPRSQACLVDLTARVKEGVGRGRGYQQMNVMKRMTRIINRFQGNLRETSAEGSDHDIEGKTSNSKHTEERQGGGEKGGRGLLSG